MSEDSARPSLTRAEMSEDRGRTRSHFPASLRRSGPIERRSRAILADSGPIIKNIARDEAKVARPLGKTSAGECEGGRRFTRNPGRCRVTSRPVEPSLVAMLSKTGPVLLLSPAV
jgi:hypothetical protein